MNIKLSTKIIFCTVLPFIFGLWYAIGFILTQKTTLTDIELIYKNIPVIAANSDFILQIQRERGRSAIYSGKGTGLNELVEQRAKTDASAEILKKVLESSTLSQSTISPIRAAFTEIPAIRAKVIPSGPTQVIVTDYSDLIQNISLLFSDVLKVTNNMEISRLMTNIILCEIAQENTGKVRASVSGILANNLPINGEVISRISLFFARITPVLNLPIMNMSEESKSRVSNLISSDAWRETERGYKTVFLKADKGDYGIDAQSFFQSATQAIDKIHEISQMETALMNKKSDEILKSSKSSVNNAIMFTVGSITIIALICFIMIRNMNLTFKRLNEHLSSAADQTHYAATEIASASNSLANDASSQAAALEQTSASLEELASMTRQNAENATISNQEMKKTKEAAEKSSDDMQQMNLAMNEISKIVKSIDEVAFQTNILALNAAVEAARAGESGLGFAVVADEVRNLAKRSAEASSETSRKIEQGVILSQKLAGSLTLVVDQARKVDGLINSISVASKEQSTGIDQINTAINQIDKTTQANAASSEETASASHELQSQAEALKQSIQELNVLVNG